MYSTVQDCTVQYWNAVVYCTLQTVISGLLPHTLGILGIFHESSNQNCAFPALDFSVKKSNLGYSLYVPLLTLATALHGPA